MKTANSVTEETSGACSSVQHDSELTFTEEEGANAKQDEVTSNNSVTNYGHADVDLKVQKCPCVKHGDVLGKYSHVINMGLF